MVSEVRDLVLWVLHLDAVSVSSRDPYLLADHTDPQKMSEVHKGDTKRLEQAATGSRTGLLTQNRKTDGSCIHMHLPRNIAPNDLCSVLRPCCHVLSNREADDVEVLQENGVADSMDQTILDTCAVHHCVLTLFESH